MDAQTALPCPYLMADPPRSSGRALLSRLLWEYCCMHWGLSPGQVAAALSAPKDADTDAGRRSERLEVDGAVKLIGGVLADGAIRAYARPVGGGEPTELRPSVWEIDDFRPRFATSAIDPTQPFNPAAAPTHWVFVDAGDGERLIEASCADIRAPARSTHPTPDDRTEQATAIPLVHTSERLLRLPEVKSRTGMPRSSIYARMSAGRFPKQVPNGGSMAAWRESEVDEWVANPR